MGHSLADSRNWAAYAGQQVRNSQISDWSCAHCSSTRTSQMIRWHHQRQTHIVGISPGIDDGTTTIATPSAMMANATGTSITARGGSSFWASTRRATMHIQGMLIAPRSEEHTSELQSLR